MDWQIRYREEDDAINRIFECPVNLDILSTTVRGLRLENQFHARLRISSVETTHKCIYFIWTPVDICEEKAAL